MKHSVAHSLAQPVCVRLFYLPYIRIENLKIPMETVHSRLLFSNFLSENFVKKF